MSVDKTFKKTKQDHVLAVLKAAVSAIPVAGGPIASLLSDYLPNEIEKRKTKLLIQLDDDLKRLKGRFQEVTLKKEEFVTTFFKSFKKAMETHQKEIIDGYRAIILNSLIDSNPNQDEITMFIGITERLTPLHVKLLKILDNPEGIVSQNPEAKAHFDSLSLGGLSTLFSVLLSDYPMEIIDIAFKDLYNLGLHDTPQLRVTMTKHGILQRRISKLGNRYLRYITLPKEVKNIEG